MTYRQYRLSGFLILLCTVAIFSAGVRDKNTVTAAFKSARLLYTYGKYDSAANYIRGFLKRYGKDPSTEYMVPLLMESLVRTHESDYFKKLTQIYYKKFPESAFVPRVYYLDGIVSAWQRDYKTSVQLFAEAMNRGLSPTLDSLALLNVRYVCERLASYDDLGSLRERSKLSSVIMEIVSFNEIKKLSENAQTGRAKQLAEDFRAKFPRSEYRQFIKRLTSDPRSRKTIVVGLLAPLSGENADLGRLVMQSVQLSVENFNDMHDQQIDLVVADTKGSMVDAAKKMQELLTVQKINFFIGPILSSTAAVAAAVQMNYKSDVVMITPTATDEGI
ncbi:MAG: ABC transporter substrate-binding protein, partial [Chitinivibrionales bacterium]|nr:ABC transporter substrate-binding protein [Chitinivibrionales bacterium]